MTAPRLTHQPALDGVRGVAVAMVLLFHGGVGWMGGGYIGVSVFFTLSGYLITSLLLIEADFAGRVRVGAFLARRARRLLPASALCIVGVALCSRYGLLDGVGHLRRDLLGATFQVQNWVLLAAGESYTDVLVAVGGQPSPLEHYWSLAIEEQFYWMWPLVFGWLATRRRTHLGRRLALLTAAAAAAAPLTAAVWGGDAAYWATPARLAEILLGAWLAVALAGRRLGGEWAWAAPVALGGLVAAAVLLPAGGGPIYRGALPLVGLASALLITGLQVASRTGRVLAWRPFTGLGRISYGVYLYHWPVYVIIDAGRTGVRGPALLAVRTAVTLAVAIASYALVERPIRTARWRPSATLAGAGAATAVVAVAAVLVPVTIAGDYWRATPANVAALAAAATPTSSPTTTSTATSIAIPAVPPTARFTPPVQPDPVGGPEPASAAASTTTPAVSRTGPARVLLVGDSTAESLGVGLVAWAAADPSLADVQLAVSPGCGFLRGGVVPTDDGVPFAEACDAILDRVVPAALTELRPHVVVLMSTSRDLLDRQWSDAEGVIGPDDARYRQRLDHDYARIADVVTASGATALFVRTPPTDPYWLGQPSMFTDPARRAVVDGVIAQLAAGRDGVEILDLRSWVEHDAVASARDARPDGLHWTPSAALDVAQRWLGPALLAVAGDAAGTKGAS